jgi:hypothetical protein
MTDAQTISAAPSALIRSGIAGLSSFDRQLIILHFGAGLSVNEIGEAYNIPHRTVAYRVKRAAERLRAWVSALDENVRLESDHVCEAVCSGFRAPSGIYRKIEPQLYASRRFEAEAPRHSFIFKFAQIFDAVCRAVWCGQRSALPQSK